MQNGIDNTLVYLAYGEGPHVNELAFSVLSALHMAGPNQRQFRIVVYTDAPSVLDDLPVQCEAVTGSQLAEWAGPCRMNDRRKMFVARHAVQKFGGRVVLCDADTYFIKDPRRLFRRLRPGHTLLHIKEGHLHYCNAGELANFLGRHGLCMRDGRRWHLTQNAWMFNSGVIGISESDGTLLDEVINLADQIYPHVHMRTVEQFAFGACFRQFTRLQEAYDVVYHYWQPSHRDAFQQRLQHVLRDLSAASHDGRYERLFPHRPIESQKILNRSSSETFADRAHIALWELANETGVLEPLKRLLGRSSS